jgi:hypothetical protein
MVQNANPKKIVETLISKFVLLYNIIRLALSDAYMNEYIKTVKPLWFVLLFNFTISSYLHTHTNNYTMKCQCEALSYLP